MYIIKVKKRIYNLYNSINFNKRIIELILEKGLIFITVEIGN